MNKKSTVCVTGSSGFIGYHLVNELLKKFDKVIRYDISHGKSILDEEKVMSTIKSCDFVFHLAGMLGTHELVDNSVEATKVNVIGTLNILNACKKHKANLIFASKPNCWLNTYSITKIACEHFIQMYEIEHGVKSIVVKWFNVYGSGQKLYEEVGYRKFIPTAIVNALKDKPIEIYGNGEQTMDLIHIKDTVEATLALIDNWDKTKGETYEIGSGKEISVNDCAEMIISLTKSKSKIRHIPMRKGELKNSKIRAHLKDIKPFWKPKVSLEEGLSSTIDYYREKYIE